MILFGVDGEEIVWNLLELMMVIIVVIIVIEA